MIYIWLTAKFDLLWTIGPGQSSRGYHIMQVTSMFSGKYPKMLMNTGFMHDSAHTFYKYDIPHAFSVAEHMAHIINCFLKT